LLSLKQGAGLAIASHRVTAPVILSVPFWCGLTYFKELFLGLSPIGRRKASQQQPELVERNLRS
jgi:hypothetical protein